MIDNIKKIITKDSISILLILFFVSEAINKYLYFTKGYKLDLAAAIKIAILGGMIIYLLYKQSKILLWIGSIVAVFIIGQLFLDPNFDKKAIINVTKYIFPLIAFAFYTQNNIDNNSMRRLTKAFEIIIVINSITILLGFLFDIQSFRTYFGHRFGYNGLLITSATSTYVYFIALFYFLIKYKERFIYSPLTLLTLLSGLLIGTKSLYLGIALILGFYILKYLPIKTRNISVLILSALTLGGFYYLFYQTYTFKKILQEDGFLSMVFSYRLDLFTDDMLPYIKKEWGVINYIFGGIFDVKTRSQMAVFDSFYFFGDFLALYFISGHI